MGAATRGSDGQINSGQTSRRRAKADRQVATATVRAAAERRCGVGWSSRTEAEAGCGRWAEAQAAAAFERRCNGSGRAEAGASGGQNGDLQGEQRTEAAAEESGAGCWVAARAATSGDERQRGRRRLTSRQEQRSDSRRRGRRALVQARVRRGSGAQAEGDTRSSTLGVAAVVVRPEEGGASDGAAASAATAVATSERHETSVMRGGGWRPDSGGADGRDEILITHVPGFDGSLPSSHYAGYVAIPGNPGKKNLFYYFIASERNPSKDPVVLWLNGGPGCSSFYGFVFEHGPFNFQAGKSNGSLPILQLNPFSWSKVSNIIYLESPCGVGFSYSNNPRNYATGDLQTASDTHAFLLKWFELYPEYLSNPFYISGESYAGVYVPTLASNVVKGIKKGEKPLINFKGYLIGNGIADDEYDGNGHVPFFFGMALISSDIFEDCQATCKGKFYDPPNDRCRQNLLKAYAAVKDLNSYDILEPCYRYPGNKVTSLPLGHHYLGVTEKPLLGKDNMITSSPQSANAFHIPCFNDDFATAWLNNEAVREAIHAAPASVAGPWEICPTRVRRNYTIDTGSMIPYHKSLISEGYRVLIYSGDHDSVVPYTGTQAWTRSLGYKIVDEWRSWISSEQVAGYLQGYDHNLTFLTVKGAGHAVPQYKPRESLDFYTRWLDGKPI
ncbi:serine carboxypeptidase-like 20 [Eucalyptus grandis]|uniref:serine carboxypeptidase-like 20 n=1 Tax=Eucalyptus grandis TaxID=71139 RepID=UPI00192F087B|nr:serine carboxypeptidase-like 20 [Eucalyptus grandis]